MDSIDQSSEGTQSTPSIESEATAATRKAARKSRPGRLRTRPRPSSHNWTSSSITIFGRRKFDGQERFFGTQIDLLPFALSSNSLLTLVLRAIPCPTDSSTLLSFSAAIKELAQDVEQREILRTRPDELASSDIRALFTAIEDVISHWPESTRYDRSTKARSYFRNYQGLLRDGTRISESRFKSSFNAGRPDKLRQGLPGDKKTSVPTTKGLGDFDTLEERNEKSLAKAIDIQQKIIDVCDKSIKGLEEVCHHLASARQAGLPIELSKRKLAAIERSRIPSRRHLAVLAPNDVLRVAIRVVDKRGFRGQRRARLALNNLTQFDEFLDTSGDRRYEALIADKFLPRHVVVACGLTILVVTGLNPDALFSLTRHNIERRSNSVAIIGLKGKTNALVEAFLIERNFEEESSDVIRVQHRSAMCALELLVENAKRIELEFNRENVPLIAGLQYRETPINYGWFSFYTELQRFCEWHKQEPIDLRSLRRLAAHVDYLSPGGSLYTTQALLGHKNRQTTVLYLNSTVIAELFQENIRRFMVKLEATALFRLGREKEFLKRGLTTKDVQPALFPLSANVRTKTLVDEWIGSGGELPFSIGFAELQHCARQYCYYRSAYERLASQNPSRFAELHLPRIIFCFALRELMLKSPHGGLLKKIERQSE